MVKLDLIVAHLVHLTWRNPSARIARAPRARFDREVTLMRMMARIQVDAADGNRAIKDGSFAPLMEKAMAELKPEAAYFVADDG